MEYVDLCIANEGDAGDVFGITAENTGIPSGKTSPNGYKDVAKQLTDRFGFQTVSITLRESISANDNNWAAMLYGGGSLGAGLIYAARQKMDAQAALEFAVAASCLKHTVEGDLNQVSAEKVAKGDGSGRVQR